jgi:lysine-specific histone demethylase 1
MLVTNGYQTIPFDLSKNSNIKVLLNSKVVKIIHHDDGTNEVKCSNGQSYFGQNVVVSVPLGVLKASGIEFDPPLPSWKKEAINNIGFGDVCKVLVSLKTKSINVSEQYIAVIDDDVNKRGMATYFLNLKSIAKLPALVTFGLGPNAI